MVGQVLVELAGDLAKGGEPGPRDGGEVVVLVVEADVVGEEVEGPVVGEGLWDGDAVGGVLLLGGDGLVDVVLCDEVAGEGVEGAGEEGGDEEVEDGVGAPEGVEGVVEGELDGDVEVVQGRQGHGVDEGRADSVEEDLEGAEEGLAEDRVEEDGLKGGGKVGVEAVDAEGLVVGEVVGLVKMVCQYVVSRYPGGKREDWLTLKEALYGTPMGRFAKIAKRRLACGERKARLWEISWMARKRFWFAVAPKT